MGHEGRGVAIEESVGQFGDHGAADVRLADPGGVDELASLGAVSDEAAAFEAAEDGGHGGEGQAPFGLEGGGDLLHGGLAAPEDAHEGELEVGELMGVGHGGSGLYY